MSKDRSCTIIPLVCTGNSHCREGEIHFNDGIHNVGRFDYSSYAIMTNHCT